MIRYVFVATEDNHEGYYTYYWAESNKAAMDKAAKAYPNYISIAIISKYEYDAKACEYEED